MGFLAHFWHWIEVHTGTVNEAGPYYGFWSGFGSDLGEVTMLAGLWAAWRHVNCHNKGCPRLGHHRTSEGHRLCKKCVAKPREKLVLHQVHNDHLGGNT